MIVFVFILSGMVWFSSKHLYAEQSEAAAASGAIATASNGVSGQSSGTSSGASTTPSQSQTTAPTATKGTQAVTTATTSTTAVSATASTSNLKGLSLYVDPARASLPSPLNTAPVATWFGSWSGDIQTAVNSIVSAAAAKGTVPVLVAYNIPSRDCGGYSAGGTDSSDSYKQWVRGFAAGIGNRQAIVILEPDALAQITCLSPSDQALRYANLSDAVTVLSQTRAFTYLDAGNSNWIGASDMASRLKQANVANATGFSLNVSNFETTANSTNYGNSISNKIGGKHFVIDTGRNGNGPSTGSGNTWCNPSGRALGDLPNTSTTGNVDAELWIKVPGESDGTCNGGPAAGTYWADYANQLIANRH